MSHVKLAGLASEWMRLDRQLVGCIGRLRIEPESHEVSCVEFAVLIVVPHCTRDVPSEPLDTTPKGIVLDYPCH